MAVSGEATVGHIIGFLRLDADQYFRTLEEADAAASKLGKRKVDIKATAKTAAARAELDSLGRSVDKVDGAQKRAAKSSDKLGAANQRNGRHMRALVVTALALGPALGPLVGTTIGLAGALGSMGAAGIVAVLGIKREIEQGTTLGLAFSSAIADLKGEFRGLEGTAANAALAPFNDIVREVTARMPFLNKSVNTFTNLLGSGSTNALTGIIDSLHTMEPLLVSAGIWVDKLLAKFASVAAGGGLKAFTDYARSTLPLVTDTLENLVVAVVDLVRAFAPMGAGVLAVLNDVSQLIAGLPVGVLTAMASAASAGFLGFQAWRGITSIVNGVVGALKFMNTEMVVSAGLARGLSFATAAVSVAIGAAVFLYAKHAEAARQDQVAVDGMTDALVASNGAITESIRLGKAKELQDAGWGKIAADNGIGLDLLTTAFLGNGDAVDFVTRKLLENQGVNTMVGNGAFEVAGSIHQQTAAFGQLGGAQDVVTGKGALLVNAMKASNGQMAQATVNSKELIGAQRETAASVDATLTAVDRSMVVWDKAGAQYGITGAALKTFEDGQRDAAAQADNARAKMILESDAAGILKGELDKLNGKTLNAAEAQNRFDSALVNMSDHTTKTGKKVVLTTKNIHGMSAASVAIRGDLLGQVRDMQALAEANGDLSGKTAGSIARLKDLRQQIIDNAVAHGHDRKAVTDYINSIFKIPKKVPPTKLEVDKAAADAKLVALQKKLGLVKPIKSIRVVAETKTALESLNILKTVITSLDGKVINITTRYATEGTKPDGGQSLVGGILADGGAPVGLAPSQPAYRPSAREVKNSANGNIFKAFANGGVESHIAQMAPAGAMRLWAEPETGGESYIPHAKSKRARSLEIWEETGRILGAKQRTNTMNVTHNGPIIANSPAEYAEDIERHNAIRGY